MLFIYFRIGRPDTPRSGRRADRLQNAFLGVLWYPYCRPCFIFALCAYELIPLDVQQQQNRKVARNSCAWE